MGFYQRVSHTGGKTVWAWGQYTMQTDMGINFESPIIEWDSSTQQAWVSPLHFKKKITSRRCLERLMDATSFLMSTES